MHRHRLEALLVINGDWELRCLMTLKDILKLSRHPHACKTCSTPACRRRRGRGEGPQEPWAALVEGGPTYRGRHGTRPPHGVLARVKWG